MARSLLLLAPLVLLLLLSGSSCREDEEVELVPPPLKVVRGLPHSPGFPQLPPEDLVAFVRDWPVSLRLDLNRPAEPGEIQLTFFPEPLSWSLRLSGTSGIAWVDGYQPAPGTRVQRILIDGPTFERPWLWEFLVVDRVVAPRGFLILRAFHHRDVPPAPLPFPTLLLLYDEQTAAGVSSARALLDRNPTTAQLALIDTSDEQRWEATTVGIHLPERNYTLAAILDTSGDGVYDPDVDWWGTARVAGAGIWLPDFQQATRDPQQSGTLEAELHPPR